MAISNHIKETTSLVRDALLGGAESVQSDIGHLELSQRFEEAYGHLVEFARHVIAEPAAVEAEPVDQSSIYGFQLQLDV